MPVSKPTVLLQDIKKLETEALVVGFFEDIRPLAGLAGHLDWLLCGALSDLIIGGRLRGSLGDSALLTSRRKVPARKIFLVGLGPAGTANADSLGSAAASSVRSAANAGAGHVTLECFSAPNLSLESSVAGMLRGIAAEALSRPANIHLLAPDASCYGQLVTLVDGASPRKNDLLRDRPAQ